MKLNLLLYSLQLERSEAWWWWWGGRRDCGIHLVNHSPHPSFSFALSSSTHPSFALSSSHPYFSFSSSPHPSSPSHLVLISLSWSSWPSHLLLIPLSWSFSSSGHPSFSLTISSTIPPSHLPLSLSFLHLLLNSSSTQPAFSITFSSFSLLQLLIFYSSSFINITRILFHNKTFTLPPHILIILFIPNLREPSR